MSTLREFLVQKRAAILARRDPANAGNIGPIKLEANVTAEGRSGVRRIRIRDFQILSDSGPDFAGYNFGPGSPELQVGVLGSCLTHIFEIQAADQEIPLDSLSVDVSADQDFRSGQPGFEHVPRFPYNLTYTVHIESPASVEDIARLHKAVEDVCPILNLLINPQTINGTVELNGALASNRVSAPVATTVVPA